MARRGLKQLALAPAVVGTVVVVQAAVLALLVADLEFGAHQFAQLSDRLREAAHHVETLSLQEGNEATKLADLKARYEALDALVKAAQSDCGALSATYGFQSGDLR